MRRVIVVALLLAAGVCALVIARLDKVALPLRTIAVGRQPVAVAVDDQTRRVFVVNSRDNTVSVLDAATGTYLATIAVGQGPEGVAVDERNAHAFVINTAGNSVSMLDAHSGAVLRTTVLGSGGGPTAIGVDGRSGRVFLVEQLVFARTTTMTGGLDVLDARTGALVRTIELEAWPKAAYPGAVAVDERTGMAFVLTGGTSPARVYMVDARSGSVLRALPAAGAPYAVVVDEQTARVFVADAVAGAVTMLDARTGAVLRTIPLASTPYAVAYTPECLALDTRGGRLYVVGTGTAGLSVLDAGSGALLRTIRLGSAPIGVAADGQTKQAFVLKQGSASGEGSVAILDASSGAIVSTVGVGSTPDAVAVDDREARLFVVNGGGSQTTPSLWDRVPAWLRRVLPWRVQSSRAPSGLGSVSVLHEAR